MHLEVNAVLLNAKILLVGTTLGILCAFVHSASHELGLSVFDSLAHDTLHVSRCCCSKSQLLAKVVSYSYKLLTSKIKHVHWNARTEVNAARIVFIAQVPVESVRT